MKGFFTIYGLNWLCPFFDFQFLQIIFKEILVNFNYKLAA